MQMTSDALEDIWKQFGVGTLIPASGGQNPCDVTCTCVDFMESNDAGRNEAGAAVWCKHVAALFYTAAGVCNNQYPHKAGGYHIFKMRGIDLCDLTVYASPSRACC